MKRIITTVFFVGLFASIYFFIAIAKVYSKAAQMLGITISPTKILEGYWNFITFKASPNTLKVLLGELGNFFPYIFWITIVAFILMVVFVRKKKLKK